MLPNIDDIISGLENKKNEKFFLILTRVDLTKLCPEYIDSQFDRVYRYLEQLEDYERCAELKKIEDEYRAYLKTK